MRANEFLDAKPLAEARALWHAALRLESVGGEMVPLAQVHGRVLAEDVRAAIDVPPFDRSIVDGYAFVAQDAFAATETAPARLRLLPGSIRAGDAPEVAVGGGEAIEIATGGVMPRGANAVQMVERTDRADGDVLIYKPVVPGGFIQAAGSDLRAGDLVFPQGTRISARESGVLAALGLAEIRCVGRPRVAVLSTGDELVAPGRPLATGQIYDANSRVIADAVRECGGVPEFLGIVIDDERALRQALGATLGYDAVVLSGGTSKGAGDLTFRLIDELGQPGIVVHGVQVKPGKPIVLAAWSGKPVVVLPGFPTSAVLTFHLFVGPVIRRLAGLPLEEPRATVQARIPERVHSAPGRHEFLLVHLVDDGESGKIAYPVPKSSGSISAFAEADGYLEVPASRDFLLAGEHAVVHLLSQGVRPADIVFAGSHCQGMDALFGLLRREHGLTTRILNVGSAAGVQALRRREADVAGIHLLDDQGYNRTAWSDTAGAALLVRGYGRRQGIIYHRARVEDPRLEALVTSSSLRLMNRARGAGTRALLDRCIDDVARERGLDANALRAALPGYGDEARSHNATAAAIALGRADWGLGVESAARHYQLGFAQVCDEEYDLLVNRERLERPSIQAMLEMLRSPRLREELEALGGMRVDASIGSILLPTA